MGRAMRAMAFGLALGLAMAPGGLWASEMLLKRPPRESFTGFGWSFLFLSAGALYEASGAYQASRSAMQQAQDSYQLYLAASVPADISDQRTAVESFHAEAKAQESRFNVAFYAGVVFGLTSFYSFFPEKRPETPFLVSVRGVWILPDGLMLLFRF